MKDTSTSPSVDKQRLVQVYRKAVSAGVPLEKIDELTSKYLRKSEVVENLETEDVKTYEKKVHRLLPLPVKVVASVLPLLFLIFGVVLLSSALVPLTYHYLITSAELSRDNFMVPVPYEQIIEAQPIVRAQVSEEDQGEVEQVKKDPVILQDQLDYTQLSAWFSDQEAKELESQKQDSQIYTIDIPKIKVYEAVVKIGGTDLKASLIHYPGTAEPGQIGAPVIFGHSLLRQFYNPDAKNPNRYSTIFSYIMTLENGDEIIVNKDGLRYVYKVIAKKEVKPEDTYILMQRYDNRLLKLVTCTPEGTYLRRGVVTAQLVE